MAAFIFFFGWFALALRRFDTSLGVEFPAFVRAVGATLMTVGLGIVLVCGGWFSLWGRGTPAIFDPPTEFVVEGPYRWVRNPMYIGALVLLTGFGLWHRSAAILLMMIVMAVAFHAFVVFLEEPGLVRRFGSRYEAYRAAVPRWIPRRPR